MTQHVNKEPETNACRADVRTWEELSTSGLLWLINRVVFHPRGFALGVVKIGGEVVGWRLLGDGREPWGFDLPEDDLFAAAQRTLTPEEPA